MVRYVENCGRGRVPAVAVTYGGRRRLLSLLCGRSERRRFIPKAAVGRSGFDRLAGAFDSVRFQSCAKKAFIRHAA